MYPDDGIYFRSGRYEERGGSIYRVGSRRRNTQKAIGKTCVQPAQSAERVSSDPFWHSAEQVTRTSGGGELPAPRVTINMHINTQPSYDPAATDASRRVFPLRKLAREVLSQRFPPVSLTLAVRGILAEDTLIYRRYSNHVSLSFGREGTRRTVWKSILACTSCCSQLFYFNYLSQRKKKSHLLRQELK